MKGLAVLVLFLIGLMLLNSALKGVFSALGSIPWWAWIIIIIAVLIVLGANSDNNEKTN